jgi:membrane protease YdiL (CAAX protease family)
VITGVFRRGIRTPDRIDSDRSAMPLLVVTALGGGAWFLTQVLYGAAVGAHFQHTHPGQRFDVDQLGAGDFAFLSTVPALAGMLVLLLGDEALGMVRRLGYAPGRLPGGVVVGVLSSIAVLPFVWGSSILLDLLYRAINFAHPAEHELLGAMKDAPQHVRVILILGACVAAPLFEELLFRAHVQTLLGRVFTSRAARETPAMRAIDRPTTVLFPEMYAVVPGSEFAKPQAAAEAPFGAAAPVSVSGAAPADAPVDVLPLEYSSPRHDPSRPRRNAWLAIFATSVLFALVHPMWMAPLIFLLALCLGYVYERTGNLWACIALHAIFNTTSTITFLNM